MPGTAADVGHGAADDEASCYETDLVALAALVDHGRPPTSADTAGDPGPAPDDPVLEAELAGFAALLASHRTDPGAHTTGDTEPDTDPDAQDGTDDDAQAAS